MPRFVLYLLLMFAACIAHAGILDLNQQPWVTSNPDPEKGMNVGLAQREGDGIHVVLAVQPGFSVYRDSLSFESAGLPVNPLSMPDGTFKEDPSFGRVEVYQDGAQVILPLVSDRTLKVRMQGCLDTGLCFEQQTRIVQIEGELPTAAEIAPQAPGSLWWFFMAGVLLALTPCVLPTLPLLLHAMSGGHASRPRQALYGMGYVSASAVSYAGLGVLIGYLGSSFDLRTALQGPIPVSLITLSLVALAAVNMGWRVPGLGFISSGAGQGLLGKIKGGNLASAAALGVVSTIMLSPCVSAPLAGIMIYLAQTGDSLYAGACLFLLGVGMGLPLLILALGGKRFIPKSGPWLIAMKEGSALLLIMAAAVNASRLLTPPQTLILIGVMALVGSIYLKLRWPKRWSKLMGATLIFLVFAYGFLCISGGINGQDDWKQPLATKQVLVDETYDNVDQLAQALGRPGPKVVVISAQWCLNCKVEERELRESNVKSLHPGVTWIKLDITHSNPETADWLQKKGLFGPPAMLFVGSHGAEDRSLRQVGNIDTIEVSKALESLSAK